MIEQRKKWIFVLGVASLRARRSGVTISWSMICLLITLLIGCSNSYDEANSEDRSVNKVELLISAAASLSEVMEQLKLQFESANEHIAVTYNFGASGALMHQIEQGAPVDIYFSAATHYMEKLVEANRVEDDQWMNLLGNELVVIAERDDLHPPTKLTELNVNAISHIAIGIPEVVPAGAYAHEALTQAGMWEKLQQQLIQARDVRQVVKYVEMGNAVAGFVYKTDALISDRVKIAFVVEKTAYSPIRYPMGIINSTKYPQAAAQFYAYLQSAEAMAIFQQYGFLLPSEFNE